MNDANQEITALHRYQGTLVGLGVGSALGQPVESMSGQQVQIKHGRVTTLLGGGWRGLRKGEYTPETDLAMVLAHQLARDGKFDRQAVAAAYVAWFKADRREVEEATRSALTLLAQGTPVEEAAREAFENATAKEADSAALLRAVPLALFHAGNVEALLADVVADTGITHHGGAVASAAAGFALLLRGFLLGGDEPGVVLARAREQLAGARTPLRDFLPADASGTTLTRATGKPADNLEVAWAAVCASPNAEKVLSAVVNGGEDAATTGAMAGALVGARLGVEGLPAKWTGGLLDRHRFVAAAAALFHAAPSS